MRKLRFVEIRDACSALAASMQEPGKARRARVTRFLLPSADRDAVMQKQREAQLLESFSRRSHPPAYVKRSTLESLLLLQARMKMRSINAIMIDFAKPGPNEGINWRVVGLISGMAERDAAYLVTKAAARKYAMWIMVDDADPRAGNNVELGP